MATSPKLPPPPQNTPVNRPDGSMDPQWISWFNKIYQLLK